MTALTDQEGLWIEELAGRLRLIQADAATATPAQRREFLYEAVSRSLQGVAPADRQRRLEALLARFPVAGQVLQKTTAPAPAPLPPPPPETFDQLLDRLLHAAGELSPQQRAAVAERLGQAGLVLVEQGTATMEVSAELSQALGLAEGQQPLLPNLALLCGLLIETLQRLDQAAFGTLRELAPKSSLLKRSHAFRQAAAQFLAGQTESVEPQLRAISSLLGALLTAMPVGGRDFGRKYVERLSPSAIEDVVRAEGHGGGFQSKLGLGKSLEERCWHKYVLLAREYETADLVNRRIRDCLAEFVEKNVLGGR